jgi:hypothetical protein
MWLKLATGSLSNMGCPIASRIHTRRLGRKPCDLFFPTFGHFLCKAPPKASCKERVDLHATVIPVVVI